MLIYVNVWHVQTNCPECYCLGPTTYLNELNQNNEDTVKCKLIFKYNNLIFQSLRHQIYYYQSFTVLCTCILYDKIEWLFYFHIYIVFQRGNDLYWEVRFKLFDNFSHLIWLERCWWKNLDMVKQSSSFSL
jgi:hypothetical protein